MPDIRSKHDLVAELQKQTSALGLNVHADAEQGLRGEAEKIGAKWWLGGRKVAYRMSCRPTEADHTVHFREAVVERSWGIPPPTLTVETTTVSGWKRSGTRKDVSVGGGGPASRSPCAAPLSAPRTVPCACAATGSASNASSIVDTKSLDFIFAPLGWDSNRLGLD